MMSLKKTALRPVAETTCRACIRLCLSEAGTFSCGAGLELRPLLKRYAGPYVCESFSRPLLNPDDTAGIAARKAWLSRVDAACGIRTRDQAVAEHPAGKKKAPPAKTGGSVRAALLADPHLCVAGTAIALGCTEDSIRKRLNAMVDGGQLPETARPGSAAAKMRARIRRMLKSGKRSHAQIAAFLGVPVSDVKAMARQKAAAA